jgi:hypothetical protein
MCRLVVSVLNQFGAPLFSAEFPSQKTAKDFIAWRIEEFIEQGAAQLVVFEKAAQKETCYSATRVADCLFVSMESDWRYALVRQAA